MSNQPVAVATRTDDELIRTLWHRGRRAALIGAASGLLLAAVLGIGLWLLVALVPPRGDIDATPSSPLVVGLSTYVVAIVVIGAAVGFGIIGSQVQRRMSEVAGQGPAGKQIRHIVMKHRTPGSPDEQARSARYARLAATFMPYQLVQFTTFYVGLITVQVGQLLRDPGRSGLDLRPLSVAVIALLVAAYAVLTPILLSQARKARDYARRS